MRRTVAGTNQLSRRENPACWRRHARSTANLPSGIRWGQPGRRNSLRIPLCHPIRERSGCATCHRRRMRRRPGQTSLRTGVGTGERGTQPAIWAERESSTDAWLIHLQRDEDNDPFQMERENLTNTTVGPVIIFQHLAVMAALGIGHDERNGSGG